MDIQRIHDPGDPRVADYRDLRHPGGRDRGVFVAESRSVVRRLLASRFRTRSILVTPPALESLGDALATPTEPPPIYVTGHDVVRRIVGFDFHRGCLAAGERGAPAAPETLTTTPGPRLLVVLEALANPDNVGGVFRNAMALGADGVLLSPGCADPLYRKTIRVSAGGTLGVPFAELDDWPRGLERLRAAGFTLIALTTRRDAVDVATLGTTRPMPRRTALLVGNEGDGLTSDARAAADIEVTIPMAAGVDSLNVATASGIALDRLAVQRARAR
jgi:tRNA G18 (ribose-2'-O)-methylase SpoU